MNFPHRSHPVRARLLASLSSAAAVAVVTACASQAPGGDGPPVRILSFTASAATVARGTTVTLSWATENASSVAMVEAHQGPLADVVSTEGTAEVVVDDDRLFILTAKGARGAATQAVLAVRVEGSASELLFTATPTVIEPGAEAVLAWSAARAASLHLTASTGVVIELGPVRATGSVVVRPLGTTHYSLELDGQQASATVLVRPGVLSFKATPEAAEADAGLTLAWTTAGATRVELRSPDRGVLAVVEGNPEELASGHYEDAVPRALDPGQLFSYELVARSGRDSHSRRLVVAVAGHPAITEFRVPEVVRTGGSFQLSWATQQADDVTLSADGVVLYRAPDAAALRSRTLSLPTPKVATTYSLIASHHRGGTAVSEKRVVVVEAPVISASATPEVVNGGEGVVLSWIGTSVRRVVISSRVDGPVHRAAGVQDRGSALVFPNESTVYDVTADNGLGETALATVSVRVAEPLRLHASENGALRAGQWVKLSLELDGGLIVGLPHPQVDVRFSDAGFDDISTSGTKLPLSTSTDDDSVPLAVDFRTQLFGRSVGEAIQVSSNGTLTFGQYQNRSNYAHVELPSAQLEAMTLAPLWTDLRKPAHTVFWQVKEQGLDEVLIVQWHEVGTPAATFQARVHRTGQVDFEYLTVPPSIRAHAGIQGPHPAWGYAVPSAPTSGMGVTFFGPRASPVAVAPVVEATFAGYLSWRGQWLRVSHSFVQVVRRRDLFVGEVMARPASSVGPAGQWLELRNLLSIPVDLRGWELTLPDATVLPLSGTIAGGGAAVVGASDVPAVNDGANVRLGFPAFDLRGDAGLGAGAVTLGRGGQLDALSWGPLDAGVALVHDVGPFLFSSDSSTRPAPKPRPATCAAASSYGSQQPPQQGSPGRAQGCGFGYELGRAPFAYFDISAIGASGIEGSFDSVVLPLDLSTAPFPFFGVPRSSAQVSANGFISFAPQVSPTDVLATSTPSPGDANLLISVFGDDLAARSAAAASRVLCLRVGAGVDPAAAAPHWVVQWHHVTHASAGDDLNFQAKLFDDGVIELHFAEMRSGSSLQFGAGSSANTWLENADGTQALVVNASSLVPGIAPLSAFRFTPR